MKIKAMKALVEMDADFSHRPEDLGGLLRTTLRTGSQIFVLALDMLQGARTVNWGISRKIISRGGGIYARLILGFPIGMIGREALMLGKAPVLDWH
ncbi:MAG: hypothetical protein V9G11_08525 [Bifidobacterium adolescentis]